MSMNESLSHYLWPGTQVNKKDARVKVSRLCNLQLTFTSRAGLKSVSTNAFITATTSS